MKNQPSINETLNELLLKVLSGIDYVSKIAVETNKSIPVVYRQLDVLVKFGILSKQRDGKKVTYGINWVTLSDVITSTLFLDFERLKNAVDVKKANKEVQKLMKDIPSQILENEEALEKLVYNFFQTDEVEKVLNKFLKEVEKSSSFLVEYHKKAFNESVDLFLDAIGALPREKQKKLLGSKIVDNNEDFLNFCRLRHLQKELVDPRKSFLKE